MGGRLRPSDDPVRELRTPSTHSAQILQSHGWRSIAVLIVVVLAGCVPAADVSAFPESEELPPLVTPSAPEPLATVEESLPTAVRAGSVERRAREMTVRIRSSGCGALGTGSGFTVGDGLIITNRHVVEDASRVSLNTWDGGSMSATVSGVDFRDDLALVRIDRTLPASGELAPSDPARGDAVTVVGYPLGGQQTLTSGEVVDFARLDSLDGPRVLRLSAEIWPGSSGGPVLDDHGRVVGVVFAIERATDYALAVPVSHLRELLAEGAAQSGAPGCLP